MNRKLILIGTMIMLMIVMSSCSSQKRVSEAQLKADISSLEEIQDCYSSNYITESPYVLTNVQVTREQLNTDEKEDIIFCDTVVENDYFKVDLSFEIRYKFYDKGGWVLDKYSFETTNYEAKTIPDLDKVKDLISHYAYSSWGDGLEFTNDESDDSENGYLHDGELFVDSCSLNNDKKSCFITCSYTSKNVNFKGEYTIDLLDDGWSVSQERFNDRCAPLIKKEFNSDFSNAIGDFVWWDDENTLYIEYIIYEISGNKVTYELKTNWENAVREEKHGNNIQSEFDSISGRFNRSIYDNHFDYLTYDGNNDVWYNGNMIFERVS